MPYLKYNGQNLITNNKLVGAQYPELITDWYNESGWESYSKNGTELTLTANDLGSTYARSNQILNISSPTWQINYDIDINSGVPVWLRFQYTISGGGQFYTDVPLAPGVGQPQGYVDGLNSFQWSPPGTALEGFFYINNLDVSPPPASYGAIDCVWTLSVKQV